VTDMRSCRSCPIAVGGTVIGTTVGIVVLGKGVMTDGTWEGGEG